jgi:hypothetical protein
MIQGFQPLIYHPVTAQAPEAHCLPVAQGRHQWGCMVITGNLTGNNEKLFVCGIYF